MVVLMSTILHGSFCKRRRWWCIASKSNDKIDIKSKVTRRVEIPWLDHVPINVVWGLCHKAIHSSNNGLPIDASIDMWTIDFEVLQVMHFIINCTIVGKRGGSPKKCIVFNPSVGLPKHCIGDSKPTYSWAPIFGRG